LGAREDLADVLKVQGGDTAAFERIVLRWQGPLINLAYRFCRDRSRAEDLAQEAFIKIYRGLSTWRADSAFSTWLFSVATNCYRSELKRIPAATHSLDDAMLIVQTQTSASDTDLHDAIRQAVLALPARYRDTLVLFYFHEMDVSETAKSLNLPEGTVKARLARGRKILQQKLPQFLGELSFKEAQ
jgi:RNA polymerase sigma-70 factor, ECF subfamily